MSVERLLLLIIEKIQNEIDIEVDSYPMDTGFVLGLEKAKEIVEEMISG